MPANYIPFAYRLWFEYVEPLTALSGAYIAYFLPATYLQMTNAPSYTGTIQPPELVVFALKQLAASFVFLGLAEALVLHFTSDLRVYRALMCAMLACDIVYLSSIRGMGGSAWYWVQPWLWDGTGWGNFGMTWIGFILRALFLYEVGF
ncbi:hypothetical protein AJ78_02297 [Emergomyces pasteurianus Ep9510]|uniref:DUF7704 domain-containing protein n=1 Tax=Emergomyces pasteurianus Ep9510 TaxID=1447872 RepID=A0A1J9PN85_9EURO|nr:hypothetical protein AJ78_02297 [Emergomyces pasteurianus Ep9510]